RPALLPLISNAKLAGGRCRHTQRRVLAFSDSRAGWLCRNRSGRRRRIERVSTTRRARGIAVRGISVSLFFDIHREIVTTAAFMVIAFDVVFRSALERDRVRSGSPCAGRE